MKTIELKMTGIGESFMEGISQEGLVRCINGFVSASDIVQFSNETNVRDVNPKASVIKDIGETYRNHPEMMAILNKGVACTAHNMSVNRKKGKVVLSQEILDGILDGGHTQHATRKAILEGVDVSKARIPIKIFESRFLTPEIITKISKALNKNTSPSSETLADRAGYTAQMKKVLSEYAEKIEWRQNHKSPTEQKMTDYMPSRTWLYLCNLMDISRFSAYHKDGVKIATGTPKSVSDKFEAGELNFDFLSPIMPDLARLFDTIILSFNRNLGTFKRRKIENIQILCDSKEVTAFETSEKYEAFKKKVKNNNKKTLFLEEPYIFDVPLQFIYVIFNAMRCYLTTDENGCVTWVVDDICKEFVRIEKVIWTKLIEIAEKHMLPDAKTCNIHILMKDNNIWSLLYLEVENKMLREGI